MTEQKLINIIEKNNLLYVKINGEENVEMVYKMFNENVMIEPIDDKTDALVLDYIGLYYQLKQEHENMFKYYIMSAEKGCAVAMHNLGNRYGANGDFDNSFKYHILAIENEYYMSLSKLCNLCKTEQGRADKLICYCTEKIEENTEKSINYIHILASFYYAFGLTQLCIRYYLKAISKGYEKSIYELANVYESNKDYVNALKYFSMLDEINYKEKFMKMGMCHFKMNNIVLMKECLIKYLNTNDVMKIDDEAVELMIIYYTSEHLIDDYIKFVSLHAFKGNALCIKEFKNKVLSNFIATEIWIKHIKNRKIDEINLSDNNCPVCLKEIDDEINDNVGDNVVNLLCGHKYCELCLKHIINKEKKECLICTKIMA